MIGGHAGSSTHRCEPQRLVSTALSNMNSQAINVDEAVFYTHFSFFGAPVLRCGLRRSQFDPPTAGAGPPSTFLWLKKSLLVSLLASIFTFRGYVLFVIHCQCGLLG